MELEQELQKILKEKNPSLPDVSEEPARMPITAPHAVGKRRLPPIDEAKQATYGPAGVERGRQHQEADLSKKAQEEEPEAAGPGPRRLRLDHA